MGSHNTIKGQGKKGIPFRVQSQASLDRPPAVTNSRQPAILSLLLVLAVLAVYWQVSGFEFVTWDDNIYITDNHHVQAGLSRESLRYAFTNLDFGHWHPLTWVSHMAAYEVFGLRPGPHHLINVFLHALNSVLLFLLLKRMTGAIWRSWFVAALFAIHPMHVESVAWVVERKDVLSFLFWVLTTWAYVGYAARKKKRQYLLLILFFALGLMSKPILVTLPFTLLLLDFWPLERLGLEARQGKFPAAAIKSLVLEKLPLLAMSAASSAITYLAGQARMGDKSLLDMVPAALRLPNAVVSYIHYIGKMLWPADLAAIYPYPIHGIPLWQVLAATIILVLISAVAWRFLRPAPYLAVGWLWFLGTLVPVNGLLVQAGPQAMADRYSYVPLLGLFIGIAWGIPDLLNRFRSKAGLTDSRKGWPDPVLAVPATLLLIALAIVARQQAGYWRNTNALFARAIAVTEDNWLAHNNLGFALYTQGSFQEAITHFNAALRIRADFENGHTNLGNALDALGKRDEAEAQYREAIRLNPDCRGANFNLGIMLAAKGLKEEARKHYQEELRINPAHAGANNNLGILLQESGRLEEAVLYYTKALQSRAGYANAHFNLGTAYAALGRMDDAFLHYQEAVRLKPSESAWRREFGGLLAQRGRLDEAISQYREALRIKPDFAEAYNSFGAALYLKKDYAGAWTQVKMCRKSGGQPSPGLLSALSRHMAEPPD